MSAPIFFRNFFLIGPTAIGKGYLVSLILEALKIGSISIGDAIKVLLTIPEWNARFGPTIKDGFLLSDEEALRIYQTELAKLNPYSNPLRMYGVDGYLRTVGQVKDAVVEGYLTRKSRVIVLNARKSTCLARLRHRIEKQTDGARLDNDKFNSRYDDHYKLLPGILEALKATEAQVTTIDANGDIRTQVFPMVQSLMSIDLRSDFGKKSRSEPREGFQEEPPLRHEDRRFAFA